MTSGVQAQSPVRSTPRGRVVFVGAGPGDPDLLTLAAIAAMANADTILLDSDTQNVVFEHPAIKVSPQVQVESLELVSSDPVERAAYVAKAVESGRRVIRLIEGDPFLDGSAASEAEACVKLGLDFDVVPGVSRLTAVPEYAGIRLDDVEGVQFITANEGGFTSAKVAPWRAAGTVVVSTRAGHVGQFAEATAGAGVPTETPVIITFRGGSHQQQSKELTLAGLAEYVRISKVDPREKIHLMVGNASVKSPHSLDWFETKPLFGWRILVPLTKDPTKDVLGRLHSYGAHHDEVPTISVEPPRSPMQMDKAIRGLVEGRFEWVVFTSVNAVRAVREKFEIYGLDARAFSGLRVASVSDKTTEALKAWGIEPDLMPSECQSVAGLAEEFPAYDHALDPINRVFLPRADIATETLAAELTELGWEVEDVTAYRTVRAAPPPADTREAIKTGKFDAVVFSSSSTVRNLVGIAGKPHHSTIVAAIGPATAKTCEEHGMRVDVIATRPDPVELVDALASFAEQRRATMVANGERVTKPSQRRPGSRRRV